MATTTLEPVPETIDGTPAVTEFQVSTGIPRRGQLRFVDVPPRRCLAMDGSAAPGSPDFQAALQVLYSVAYGIHFGLRRLGVEARVGTLEGLWEYGVATPGEQPVGTGPSSGPAAWPWTLIIEIPAAAPDSTIDEARRDAVGKHPELPHDRLRIMTFEEGRVVEALHVGPYATEPETIERMTSAAEARGLTLHGFHHEIYLGDPRRSAPERLRTILRLPVR